MVLGSRLGRQPLAALRMAAGSTTIGNRPGRRAPIAIVIDMQNGLWDRMSRKTAVATARSSAAVLVRVVENSLAIGQALDAGVEGVIVPLVDHRPDAKSAAAIAQNAAGDIKTAPAVGAGPRWEGP
jgi:2-dehydro-3-deoxyglucarate aldolase/4-hydroxy-2-oxoheptanedioate aldolase